MARIMRGWIVNAMLALVSASLGFAIVEAAYRYRVYEREPDRFLQRISTPASIGFRNRPVSEFDRELGFTYRRDSPVIAGRLVEGRLTRCRVLKPSHFGGLGSQESWPPDAELKVAVVGDSFTATTARGRTWTDALREGLAARLGKKVGVINLGQDGTGILQMIDVAARKLPELKPGLLVIAFITDDLTRARIWRTVAVVDGFKRIFTTSRPQIRPDLRYSADTLLISDKVTMEWCNRKPAPARDTDPVVRELETRYRLAAQLASGRADLYTLRRSFVLDRILRGSPFPEVRGSPNPRHALSSFADDPAANARLRAIAASVSVMLFHMATRTELKAGREYLFTEEARQTALLRSLEALAGKAIVRTTDHLAGSPDVESIGKTSTNDHPSAYGMRVYAEAAADAIARDPAGYGIPASD